MNDINKFEPGKTYVAAEGYDLDWGVDIPDSILLAKVIKRTKNTVTVEVGYKGHEPEFVKTCKVREYYKGKETILPKGTYGTWFTSDKALVA